MAIRFAAKQKMVAFHTTHTTPVLKRLLLAIALLAASGAMRGQEPRHTDVGLSGYVLTPDGTPVSHGNVVIQSPGARTPATTSIERTGRFRVVPYTSGMHQVVVSVPDFATYRVSVSVPASRTLKLPVIRLSPATYFRVRLVSPAGEALLSPRFRRQSMDLNGMSMSDPFADRVLEQVDGEGRVTIGPLPRGVTMLALDMPPLAQTRLPDLLVAGTDALLDAGTVIIEPGAVLHVDVVDETGAPVPKHDVSLQDFQLPSPLVFPAVRTDQRGRATFDRLGRGRYRLVTGAKDRCNGRPFSISRLVTTPGAGTLYTRLIIGGVARFTVTSSALGPLRGVSVSASPESGQSSPPAWLRSRSAVPSFVGRPASCLGTTDGDGRVTLTNFPPGPARIDVQLLNSKHVSRVSVPDDGREVAVVIPDGYLPLRVTDAIKNTSVAGASVTWTGNGARVEATTSANGEALLAGVGAAGGTLTIEAGGYQRLDAKLDEPPASLHEVTLVPMPPTNLSVRVLTTAGELPNGSGIVELSPEDPFEQSHIGVSDAKGRVAFLQVPRGALRVVASADGFIPAEAQLAADHRSEVVLTLTRGYRVIASVEMPAVAGSHLVRVVDLAGRSMEALLDIASDRRIEPPTQISLGPLPPGDYVIELHGSRERSQQRIRIVDRDVHTTFR
jgi:hypothetical protein